MKTKFNVDPVRVIPLGGLGRIGSNMTLVECGPESVLIDAGIIFPDEETPGVEFGVPDIGYIQSSSSKLKAILITHGHEDHIGALPFILPGLQVPVYCSRLTGEMIKMKTRRERALGEIDLRVVLPYQSCKVGAFEFRMFPVSHSIPDSMGIVLETPVGKIVFTGDFKIDYTPVGEQKMEIPEILKAVQGDVLLLCSDSTNADSAGHTDTERSLYGTLSRVMSEAKGRVFVATFASLISRIQQVVDTAVEANRYVAVVGKGMVDTVGMAATHGYLKIPEGRLLPLKNTFNMQDSDVVVILTGSQGEPGSALDRISQSTHPEIKFAPGDTLVVSASPIPGNESRVAKVINRASLQGVRVVYSRTDKVHVSGHGRQEDLKTMLNLTSPKFFMPVHGETKHLVAHAHLALSMGMSSLNIFLMQNGEILEIDGSGARLNGSVQSGTLYLNGKSEWLDDGKLFSERLHVGQEGVVAVFALINADEPDELSVQVHSSGVVGSPSLVGFHRTVSRSVEKTLKQHFGDGFSASKVERSLRRGLESHISKMYGKDPVILISVKRVSSAVP